MTAEQPRQPSGRTLTRRGLLAGGAAAAVGAGAYAVARDPEETASSSASASGSETLDFHGVHQRGVIDPPQEHLVLLGLDLSSSAAEDLRRLLVLLTDDAARLTTGLPALADLEQELAVEPGRLSVTFGFGPRIFTDVLPEGTATAWARPLPGFSTDELDDAWGQTDLVVQICSDSPTALAHARRLLVRDSRRYAEVRWVQDGFRGAPAVPAAVPGHAGRNLLGHVDGIVNPADDEVDSTVWIPEATDPALAGGTHLVVRRVRFEMDQWERAGRLAREFAVGRRLADGSPLSGTSPSDPVDLTVLDDVGFPRIDPASHIARSRGDNETPTMHRRSYNYDAGGDDGTEVGLVFMAYQADAAAQFVPVQERLAELDLLNQYTRTIGSAIYTVLPGAQPGAPIGAALLEGVTS